MALAVQVDVADALAAAGIDINPGVVGALERDVRSTLGHRPASREPIPDLDLDAEIERIARLDIPARTKILLLRTVVDLHEQAQAEQRREPSNTHCDKETG